MNNKSCYICVLIFGLLFSWHVSLPSAIPEQNKTELMEHWTILFLGDSLTEGYGLSNEESYPSLVGRLLEKEGLHVEVRNAGRSGDTSAAGLFRLNKIVREQCYDLAFIALGANDGMRGLPPANLEKNLLSIVSSLNATCPKTKVVIAGMRVLTNMGERYSKLFDQVFVNVVTQVQVCFMPFLLEGVAADPKLNQPDGIHPNADGQKVIAGNVASLLLRFIRSSSR